MPGTRHALVVATDEYLDGSLSELSSPASDARALADVLGDPTLGEFEVEVLHNEESRDIAVRLEELLTESRPDDVVLVHFSCHGLKDDSGHLYLAAHDTLPNRLWSTAVDATFVNRLIRKSRAGQVLLLLDCCYGGAFEKGMVTKAAGDVDVGMQFQQEEKELVAGRGRAVITASSAMEYAFEGTQLQSSSVTPEPSVFTNALTDGLRTGEADRDQDGLVTLGELYEHVYDRVRVVNPKQTPGKWEYGTQGELVVARNPNRRVTPTALPESLQPLVDHPFAPTRHGAVKELQKLASGTNLPLAATARSELVRLKSDDSHQVCTAAAEAAGATAVFVDEEQVDAGTVEQGAVVTQVVELRGVPLVDASKAHAEGDGVTVRQVGRRLTIELDTSEPREVDASVQISGPAGELTITVHGTVVPPPEVVPEEPAPEEHAPPVQQDDPPVHDDPPVQPDPPTVGPAALVILLGTVGAAATLSLDWTTGSVEPLGPPANELVAWGGATYLLPLAVLVVGAGLLLARGPTPARLGVVTGAAAATVVVMGQQAVRFLGADQDWAPSTGYWWAVLCRLVALAGALVATWLFTRSLGWTRREGGLLRVLAAVVVVTATVGGYVLATRLVTATPRAQLTVFLSLGLVIGLLASLLALSRDRRHTFLAMATSLTLLVALSDLQLWGSRLSRDAGNAKWQLIDATVAAVVLLVVWLVQGQKASRSRREAPDPDENERRESEDTGARHAGQHQDRAEARLQLGAVPLWVR